MLTHRALTLALVTVMTLAFTSTSHAWGRRGHAIVCETAAALALRAEPKAKFLGVHSFDLSYYCNTPDLSWKKPATYARESFNHFMDLEIFDLALKGAAPGAKPEQNPFEVDRLTFNAAHPEIKDDAGRAYWRIRELETRLGEAVQTLTAADLTTEKRHASQLDWLVTAGAIGHYVGDLSQPLHVTENYDGQKTDQKGIHSFFEEAVVDELFQNPVPAAFQADVAKEALKQAPSYAKKAAKLTTLQIIEDLASSSNRELAALLKIDKRVGRKDVSRAAVAYRTIIVSRLASASLALGEIWRRHVEFDFDEKKFYSFAGDPEFIAPPAAAAAKE